VSFGSRACSGRALSKPHRLRSRGVMESALRASCRFRPRGVTGQALSVRRDSGHAARAGSASRALSELRLERCTAGHVLRGSSRLRSERHTAERASWAVCGLRFAKRTMAWPVSNTVDGCPSGCASRGRWATGGCEVKLRSRCSGTARKGSAITGAVDRQADCCGNTLQRRSRARKADVACLHIASNEWSEDPRAGSAI